MCWSFSRCALCVLWTVTVQYINSLGILNVFELKSYIATQKHSQISNNLHPIILHYFLFCYVLCHEIVIQKSAEFYKAQRLPPGFVVKIKSKVVLGGTWSVIDHAPNLYDTICHKRDQYYSTTILWTESMNKI